MASLRANKGRYEVGNITKPVSVYRNKILFWRIIFKFFIKKTEDLKKQVKLLVAV